VNASNRLRVEGLHVAYRGNVAVEEATFDVPSGRITGLIGPNGAGKTTTFNACNGLVEADRGRVFLSGVDVTARSTAHRARLGMGRTFQQVQVCSGMTVRANVALGAEVSLIGSNPLRQFAGGRQERREVERRTGEAMAQCGIGELAERSASLLSTGQRRLVELARVLAGGYSLLLLDEPSSGLDEQETDRFGQILLDVVAERDIAILLVEHDMSLVMSVCSYIYVLDFGVMIFEGTPGEVQSSPKVRSAYLGEDASSQEAAR
jgi:ABC-type branched-subunit amino acid transport system ATPase component